MVNTANHKFSCELRPGVSVSATVDVEALRKGKGKLQYLAVEWTGKPNRNDLAAYVQWMFTVQQKCSETLGGRILYGFLTDIGADFYVFEPGRPCRRLA